MKTKYLISNNKLIISFKTLYNLIDLPDNISNLRKYVNQILINNNIHFLGNKITIYVNGILVGNFYLTNYYLKKLITKKNYLLTPINSFFQKCKYIEINDSSIKFKSILLLKN